MVYDVLILGGGAAGLTAAMYAARGGAKTLVVEKMMPGGQAGQIVTIENYPGAHNVSGFDLAQTMFTQATEAGAELVYVSPKRLVLDADTKQVETDSETYLAKTVIIATGANPKRLGIKNEEKLGGQGVSYCASCDGAFYKNKTVVVAGGGNHAVTDALYLHDICKKVYLVHRGKEFRASDVLLQKLRDSDIEILTQTALEEAHGEPLSEVVVKNLITSEETRLAADGLFIAVGRTPDTGIVPDALRDADGFIATDEEMRTQMSGVFAAGDVRKKFLRQVVTAAADGAIAAESALLYLKTNVLR